MSTIRFYGENENPFNIKLIKVGEPDPIQLNFKCGDSEWAELNIGEWIEAENENVFISGNNNTFSKNSKNYYQFVTSGDFVGVGGELSALTNKNTLKKYQFINLFKDCKTLKNALFLNIGYDKLKNFCFSNMFMGCDNLITAPSTLPATKMADWAYSSMFNGCTSLTNVPEISATKMADNCFYGMFYGCKNITEGPSLSAVTELAPYCFNSMFANCYNLQTGPVLTVSTLVDGCYKNMFMNCKQLSSISVAFTEWDNNTQNWMNILNRNGTFSCSFTLPRIESKDYFPIGWKKKIYIDQFTPFGFEAREDNTVVKIEKSGEPDPIVLKYSYDGDQWEDLDTTSGEMRLNKDQFVLLSGANDHFNKSGISYYNFSTPSGSANVFGNIQSLTNFDTEIRNAHQYCELFYNNNNLIDASKLILPNNVTERCYFAMFSSAGSLTAAPTLPATNMANRCYEDMFSRTNSLRVAPALPAMNLADRCYYRMFATAGLTNSPTLPAKVVESHSYDRMFYSCSQLTGAGDILAETVKDGGCGVMFAICLNLQTPPVFNPSTIKGSGCNGMFSMCNLTAGVNLNIMNVENAVYSQMYAQCRNLSTAPALPATGLSENCYDEMFFDCSNITAAPALPAKTLLKNCYKGMFTNCTKLSTITASFSEWGENCTTNWLNNVSPTGTFYKPYMLPEIYGASNIPSGWTVEKYFTEDTPLTIEALNNNVTVSLSSHGIVDPVELKCNVNGNGWENFDPVTGSVTLNNVGDFVAFSGANEKFNDVAHWYTFVISNTAKVLGNIMSLVNWVDQLNYDHYNNQSCFRRLFYRQTNLVDASDLIVPKKFTNYFLYETFDGCTALTAAPRIENITIITDTNPENSNYSFARTFNNCRQLSSVQMSIANYNTTVRYEETFYGCRALTAAPILPTLSCEFRKTYGECRNLPKAPFFDMTELKKSQLEGTFKGCTSISAVEVKFTEWTEYGTNNGSTYSGWFDAPSWTWNPYTLTGIFIKPEALPIIRGGWYIKQDLVVLNRINGNLYFAEDTEWDGIQYSAGDIYPGEDPYAEYYQ